MKHSIITRQIVLIREEANKKQTLKRKNERLVKALTLRGFIFLNNNLF